MKKKVFIAILIATAFFTAVAIFFIFFTKGSDDILFKIPNNSKSVLIVDIHSISKKLILDGLGQQKSISQLSESVPDSLAAINWNESGLNLFDKLVLFTIEDSDTFSTNVILEIKDNKKYSLFIDSLSSNFNFSIQKQDNNSFAYWKSLGILIAWNKNFVSGMKTNENSIKNRTILKTILATPKNQSIMSDIDFAKKLKKTYDILFYSKSYIKNPFKKLEILNSNIQNMAFYINFNDGEIETTVEIKTKPTSIFTRLFSPQNKDFFFINDADTSTLNISLNVEPDAFSQIFNQYSNVQFKEKDNPYLKAWNGGLNLVINGFKNIENEYITYEFDDNFNKIEIKKSKEEKILNLQAVADFSDKKLDSTLKLNKPFKDGKDTLLFKGSNYILKKENNYFLSYHKLIAKAALEKKLSNSNISIHADCQKLIIILEEFGIKADNKWLNNNPLSKFELFVQYKEEVKITSTFYFTDKKKNSLFSLLNYLEKSKP